MSGPELIPTAPATRSRRSVLAEIGAVFIGGAAGSALRAVLPDLGGNGGWLLASLLPNLLACALIGWLYARSESLHPHAMTFGAIGFCGGLSTFSGFAAEIAAQLSDGRWAGVTVATGAELLVGLMAVLLGERLGRRCSVGAQLQDL